MPLPLHRGAGRHHLPHFVERFFCAMSARMDELAGCDAARGARHKAPHATYITDADWKITHVSTGFTLLTGLGPLDVLGKTPAEIIPAQAGAEPIAPRTAHDRLSLGCLLEHEGRLPCRDGTRLSVRVYDTPLFDDEGRLMNVIGEIVRTDDR